MEKYNDERYRYEWINDERNHDARYGHGWHDDVYAICTIAICSTHIGWHRTDKTLAQTSSNCIINDRIWQQGIEIMCLSQVQVIRDCFKLMVLNGEFDSV